MIEALTCVPGRYIRTSEAFSEHEGHLFGVSELFVSFCPEQISKTFELF